MKLVQSIAETRGASGLGPSRRPTTADFALARFYARVLHVNAGSVRDLALGGWSGGEAWIKRLRAAKSEFDLEQELRDAERFGSWLNKKTRVRGAKAALVRLAELRGEVLAQAEIDALGE